MTRNQKRVLDFVRQQIEAEGVAPTLEEIRVEIGHKNKGSVHAILCGLIGAGHLVRQDRRERGLALPHIFLGDIPTDRLVAGLERRGWRRIA